MIMWNVITTYERERDRRKINILTLLFIIYFSKDNLSLKKKIEFSYYKVNGLTL